MTEAPRSGGTPAAAPPLLALTRSRIDHWLRNRGLVMYDGTGSKIGFGATVDVICALIEDLAEYAGSLPGAPEQRFGYPPQQNFPEKCNGCGRWLLMENLYVDDGCPCNTPRGVNFKPQPCATCGVDNCVKPAHRLAELFEGSGADSGGRAMTDPRSGGTPAARPEPTIATVGLAGMLALRETEVRALRAEVASLREALEVAARDMDADADAAEAETESLLPNSAGGMERLENLVVLHQTTHLRSHKQQYPDKKVCVTCGADFLVNPRKRRRNKCCSPRCAMALRIAGRKRQVSSRKSPRPS